MAREHHIDTTHASVARAIEHVSDGACSASTLATVLRLRREAPAVADRMILILDTMCAQAGLPSSDAGRAAAAIDYGKADRAHRLMERHMRLAGCTSAAAEHTLEKYEPVVSAVDRALNENEPSVATLRLEELGLVHAVAPREMERLTEPKSPEKAAVQPSAPPVAGVPTPVPEGPALWGRTAQAPPAAAAPATDAMADREIGRNEHCPCGSGRRYKKCCGSGATTSEAPTPALAVG